MCCTVKKTLLHSAREYRECVWVKAGYIDPGSLAETQLCRVSVSERLSVVQ